MRRMVHTCLMVPSELAKAVTLEGIMPCSSGARRRTQVEPKVPRVAEFVVCDYATHEMRNELRVGEARAAWSVPSSPGE